MKFNDVIVALVTNIRLSCERSMRLGVFGLFLFKSKDVYLDRCGI